MRATLSPLRVVFAVLAFLWPPHALIAETGTPAEITDEAARGACPSGLPPLADSHCIVEKFGVVGTIDGKAFNRRVR